MKERGVKEKKGECNEKKRKVMKRYVEVGGVIKGVRGRGKGD